MEQKYVVPGEFLGTEEEFISGRRTYEHDGKIYSSNVGQVEIGNDFSIKVKSEKKEIFPQIGDEVVGVITDINEPLVVVSGEYLIKKGEIIPFKMRALVHASRVTGHYLDQCSKVLKLRDVVIGKIVSMRGKIDLSLESPVHGVLHANCSRCRSYLEKINTGLYCTHCQKTETRKLSSKYGDFSLENRGDKNENRQ